MCIITKNETILRKCLHIRIIVLMIMTAIKSIIT